MKIRINSASGSERISSLSRLVRLRRYRSRYFQERSFEKWPKRLNKR